MADRKVAVYIRFGSQARGFCLPEEREAFRAYMNHDKKQKAAVYCRVASEDNVAIENQRQILRRLAAEHGYEDCAEYLDNGESGLSLDRPAFSQLHNDMLAGKIKSVFVLNTSRIGRDLYSTMKWLEQAQTLGVEVISRNGDLPDNALYSAIYRAFVEHQQVTIQGYM